MRMLRPPMMRQGLAMGLGLSRGQSAGGGFSLDFTTGSLPSAVTLTRASSGTYFNSSGVLSTASNNVARFDYNPATLAARGLLIEGAATNLCLRSQEFDNAAYGADSALATANTATAPDGTSTADTISESTDSNRHIHYQQLTVANVTVYTYSIFLKYVDCRYVVLGFDSGNTPRVWFDLVNGAITDTFGASGTIENMGNGWYRCSITSTTGDTTAYAQIGLSDRANDSSGTFAFGMPSYTGTNRSVYAWGAQAELGAVATSYIPTTSATVTRAKDEITVTVPAGFSTLTATFDDDSTQTGVACVVGANVYDSADFDRDHIKTLVGVA